LAGHEAQHDRLSRRHVSSALTHADSGIGLPAINPNIPIMQSTTARGIAVPEAAPVTT